MKCSFHWLYVEGFGTRFETFEQVGLHVAAASCSHQCGQHVFVCAHFIDDGAGLDHPGPADHAGYAVCAFVLGIFFTAEGGSAAVGPAHNFGPIVGGIHHDGVVGDAQLVDRFQDLAHVHVVLHHTVWINAQSGFILGFIAQVGENVHARGVVPKEHGLAIDNPKNWCNGFILRCLG
jgi:hypothetical protein